VPQHAAVSSLSHLISSIINSPPKYGYFCAFLWSSYA
jgi:hypothetical protein